MKNDLKKISFYIFVVGLVCLLSGITYSFFNYTEYTQDIVNVNGTVFLLMDKDNTDIVLNDVFPETYSQAIYQDSSYTTLRTDNMIDFTIRGKNTYRKPVYYEIRLDYGEDIPDKTRIDSKYLCFELLDITDPLHPLKLYSGMNIDDAFGQNIYVDTINDTDTNYSRTFRLRVWYDERIIISDTDPNADFRSSNLNNNSSNMDKPIYTDLFSSTRVYVYGDYLEKTSKFAYLKFQADNARDEYGGYPTDPYFSCLFPVDEYVEDESFSSLIQGIQNIYFDSVNDQQLNDFLNNDNLVYNREIQDNDLSKEKIYLFVLKNDNYTSTNHYYNCYIVSKSVIIFPEDSSHMFGYKFFNLNDDDDSMEQLYEACYPLTLRLFDDYATSDDISNWGDKLDLLNKYIVIDSLWGYLIPPTKAEELFNELIEEVNGIDVSADFYDAYWNDVEFYEYMTSSEIASLYFSQAVMGLINVEAIYFNNIYTGNVKDMSFMFYRLPKLRILDLSNFNTKNVTDMGYMFYALGRPFNIHAIDVSDYPDLNFEGYTFPLDDPAVYINISSFDTSKVERLDMTFAGSTFNNIEGISNLNTSNVKDISGIFTTAKFVNQECLDLSRWDTSNVERLFYYDVPDTWGIDGVYDQIFSTHPFAGLDVHTINISNWDFSKCLNVSYIFRYTKIYEFILRNLKFNKDTNLDAFISYHNSNENFDSYVGEISIDFTGTVFTDYVHALVLGCDYTNTDPNVNNIYTSINFTNCVFGKEIHLIYTAPHVIKVKYNFTNADTSRTENMQSMFQNCNFVDNELDISSFDTHNVRVMSYMFDHTNLYYIYVGDRWDVSSVNQYSDIFNNSSHLRGGNGTTHRVQYDSSIEYAVPDLPGQPGLLTYRSNNNNDNNDDDDQ